MSTQARSRFMKEWWAQPPVLSPSPAAGKGGDVLVVGLREVEQTGRTKQGLNQNQKVPSLKASAQEDSS